MKKSIPFYQSKTFWLNIIMGGLTLCGVLTAPDSAFHFGAKGLSIIAGITTVLNLALRLFSTSKPIEGTNA